MKSSWFFGEHFLSLFCIDMNWRSSRFKLTVSPSGCSWQVRPDAGSSEWSGDIWLALRLEDESIIFLMEEKGDLVSRWWSNTCERPPKSRRLLSSSSCGDFTSNQNFKDRNATKEWLVYKLAIAIYLSLQSSPIARTRWNSSDYATLHFINAPDLFYPVHPISHISNFLFFLFSLFMWRHNFIPNQEVHPCQIKHWYFPIQTIPRASWIMIRPIFRSLVYLVPVQGCLEPSSFIQFLEGLASAPHSSMRSFVCHWRCGCSSCSLVRKSNVGYLHHTVLKKMC